MKHGDYSFRGRGIFRGQSPSCFKASWGQALWHSPQRTQSGELGAFQTGMSSLQAFWQAPQEVHFSSSTRNRRKAMGLKSPYTAPRGQRYRQKGRQRNTERTTRTTGTRFFQANSQPTASRRLSFIATRGSPAVSVPAGQMALQNQGWP